MTPRRRHLLAVGVVVALWIVTTLLWLTPGLTRPDGVAYFAYLPSTLLDRDLLFFDEWRDAGLIRPDGSILFKDPTPTGHLSNHWTAGASLAWYPSYVAGHLLALANDAAGTGSSIWHVAAIAWTSALAGLLVMLQGLRLGGRMFGLAPATAAVCALWLGSPMAFYATRHASMSHAVSAAACAAVVLLSLRLRDGITPSRVFATGLAIGFACAVRPQNVVIAAVPFLIADAVPLLRRTPALAAGGLLAALPQLVASQAIYGGPLVFVNIGGRAHTWQMFTRFRPLEMMVSWYHGLVTWTPLLVLAVAGFIALWQKDRRLGRAALFTFAAQWLLLAVLERWFWGGASFGQRRFDSCTLFFILGLAALWERLPRWLTIPLAAACTAWTMVLFIAASRLNLNRFQTLAELIAAFEARWSDPVWRSFLGFSPPELRGEVIGTGVVILLLTLTTAAVAWRFRRFAPAAAGAYFAAMTLFYGWCGAHPKHDAASLSIVRQWQEGALPSAGVLDSVGLLRDEAIYMERVGRHREAADALREASSLRP